MHRKIYRSRQAKSKHEGLYDSPTVLYRITRIQLTNYSPIILEKAFHHEDHEE
jgi:hypothetical protein